MAHDPNTDWPVGAPLNEEGLARVIDQLGDEAIPFRLTNRLDRRLREWFDRECPHPAPDDVVSHPESLGVPSHAPGAVKAAAIFAWRPSAVAMRVSKVFVSTGGRIPNVAWCTLTAPTVKPVTQFATHAPAPWKVGDTFAVALHGLWLPDGRRVWHYHFSHKRGPGKFGVFCNCEILGPTDAPVGTDLTAAYGCRSEP